MDTQLIVKLLAIVGAGTIVAGVGVVLSNAIFYLVPYKAEIRVQTASSRRYPRRYIPTPTK